MDRPFVRYPYVPTAGGGKPIVWVELVANGKSITVPTTLTPHCARTRLAPRWGRAVEYSGGQAVDVHFQDRSGMQFGPDVGIVPELEPVFDRAFEYWLTAGAPGGLGMAYEGLALGHDVLQHFDIVFMGAHSITVVILRPDDDEKT